MDKLSKLISEARPLYKQRKRRKKILASLFILCLPAYIFGSITRLYMEGSDIYVALENHQLQEELMQDDYGIRLDN